MSSIIFMRVKTKRCAAQSIGLICTGWCSTLLISWLDVHPCAYTKKTHSLLHKSVRLSLKVLK